MIESYGGRNEQVDAAARSAEAAAKTRVFPDSCLDQWCFQTYVVCRLPSSDEECLQTAVSGLGMS
jgi:hypothetical protein